MDTVMADVHGHGPAPGDDGSASFSSSSLDVFDGGGVDELSMEVARR